MKNNASNQSNTQPLSGQLPAPLKPPQSAPVTGRLKPGPGTRRLVERLIETIKNR
jgi:hypothetical protein